MCSLLERLRKNKDNRGMMANLRCILVNNKKHRAWPALNRLGVPITEVIPAFVAGLYATYPEGDSGSVNNFGDTCWQIDRARAEQTSEFNDNSDNTKVKNLTPTERRFQYLLAADRNEIQERVMRMLLMAKSHGAQVNYEKMLHDLKYWGERTKTEWAASFWTSGTNSAGVEDI